MKFLEHALSNNAEALDMKVMGVMEFFPKGTSFDELIEWSRKNITYATVGSRPPS